MRLKHCHVSLLNSVSIMPSYEQYVNFLACVFLWSLSNFVFDAFLYVNKIRDIVVDSQGYLFHVIEFLEILRGHLVTQK